MDEDLEDDERRGCLGRVAPLLLCRCLCRARRRPVGQASPPPRAGDAYGDDGTTQNPMANDGLIARPSVEIVEQPRRPFEQDEAAETAPLAAPPPAPAFGCFCFGQRVEAEAPQDLDLPPTRAAPYSS